MFTFKKKNRNTLEKKLGTLSKKNNKNTLKLFKKKKAQTKISTKIWRKKIVTKQNNGRPAQHQAHGKPNKAQQITKKKTHGLKKKKHQNPNTEQFTQSEASNQKSVHQKSLKLKQA